MSLRAYWTGSSIYSRRGAEDPAAIQRLARLIYRRTRRTQRQKDGETGTRMDTLALAVHPQVPILLMDEPGCNPQTQARTFAALHRKKRFKNSFFVLRGDATSIIGEHDLNSPDATAS
jgi:hypothetical protein